MRTFEEFSDHVANHHWIEGFVLVSRIQLASPSAELRASSCADLLSSSLGFGTLGERWDVLSRENFTQQLVDSLKLSLAYSVEMLPHEEAVSVVEEFLNFFDSNLYFLVNGTRHSWNPITKSTMETAYVVVSGEHAGIFLFEDED